MAWDAYADADARAHLDVIWEPLPGWTGGGLYVNYRDGTALIALDPALEGPARRDVLVHELVHDERGGGAHGRGDARFRPERAKEEARVRAITAERLVPVEDVQRFCDCQADLGQGVGPDEVAREFEVTWRVACDALDNLTRYERGR